MIEITRDALEILKSSLEVHAVRKTATTKARLLTESDYQTGLVSPQKAHESPIPSHIWTREGLVSFEVGDILCQGAEGELWPMKVANFNKIKIKISLEADSDGFDLYTNTVTYSAIRMTYSFACRRPEGELVVGEPGDWLLFSESSIWPVGQSIFEKTYEIIA